MEEHIRTFAKALVTRDGLRYIAHAHGARTSGGTWHGWLVFEPQGGGPTLRTERETTQPERGHLVYWATGLEPVYLEGALARATPV